MFVFKFFENGSFYFYADGTVHDVQTRSQRSRGQRQVRRVRGGPDTDDFRTDEHHLRVSVTARR